MLTRKIKQTKGRVRTAVMLILLGMALTACSKEQEAVETEIFSMPDRETESMETEAAETETLETQSTETESTEIKSEETKSTLPKQPEKESSEENVAKGTEGSGTEGSGTEGSGTEGSGTEGSETVEGMIDSIEDSSFTILKTQKKEGAGGLVEVGTTDEVCKIIFSNETKFLLRKVKNNGMNPSDSSQSETTKDALVKSTMAKATGSTTKEGFLATEVIVYQF